MMIVELEVPKVNAADLIKQAEWIEFKIENFRIRQAQMTKPEQNRQLDEFELENNALIHLFINSEPTVALYRCWDVARRSRKWITLLRL